MAEESSVRTLNTDALFVDFALVTLTWNDLKSAQQENKNLNTTWKNINYNNTTKHMNKTTIFNLIYMSN